MGLVGRRLVGPLAAAAAALAAAPVAAAGLDFPSTEFAENARAASVSLGDVTATVTMRPLPESDADMPVLTVAVAGRLVAEVEGIESWFDFPTAQASIAEIDPANGYPEVYFSSYSGGAHCCSTVIVVEEVAGRWTPVAVGDFDGGGDYLDDIDQDGLAEIVTVDNRFLYRFDCYACSAAPLVMYTVRDGRLVDVTTESCFIAAHRDWLSQFEATTGESERWASPGFLAGWLAAKVRVGEGASAWAELNARWNFAEDPGEETCLTGGPPEDCAARDLQVLSFPDRLKLFLEETGYRF